VANQPRGRPAGPGNCCAASSISPRQRKTSARPGALLGLLSAAQIGACETAALVGAVVQLTTTTEDKHRTLGALLSLLTRQADGWTANELVAGVIQLSPTARDKRQARKALLALLTDHTSGPLAAQLTDDLVQFDPIARVITTWPAGKSRLPPSCSPRHAGTQNLPPGS
jgi:hypothetical protein